jgi:hypothetical protein
VAALVPLAQGSSSAKTAAALPKGIRAASLAVKKLSSGAMGFLSVKTVEKLWREAP